MFRMIMHAVLLLQFRMIPTLVNFLLDPYSVASKLTQQKKGGKAESSIIEPALCPPGLQANIWALPTDHQPPVNQRHTPSTATISPEP